MTIFSLLLTLLLGCGIWAWSAGRRDECTAYLGGDSKAPASVVVETGTRDILVPCKDWLPRQSREVQALCLLMVCGAVVFLVSAWADWKRRAVRKDRGEAIRFAMPTVNRTGGSVGPRLRLVSAEVIPNKTKQGLGQNKSKRAGKGKRRPRRHR